MVHAESTRWGPNYGYDVVISVAEISFRGMVGLGASAGAATSEDPQDRLLKLADPRDCGAVTGSDLQRGNLPSRPSGTAGECDVPDEFG